MMRTKLIFTDGIPRVNSLRIALHRRERIEENSPWAFLLLDHLMEKRPRGALLARIMKSHSRFRCLGSSH